MVLETRRIRGLTSVLDPGKIGERKSHTWPAQKISLGHQACFGGRAAWLGRGWSRGAVGLGTEVETLVGVPVVAAEVLAVSVLVVLSVDDSVPELVVLAVVAALVVIVVVGSA